MTKALCIKEGGWKYSKTLESTEGPSYMEEVSIIETGEVAGYPYVCLSEYEGVYHAIYFIPLSDIDETELINQKQDELCDAL